MKKPHKAAVGIRVGYVHLAHLPEQAGRAILERFRCASNGAFSFVTLRAKSA